MGLAISAKISFALPSAGAALFLFFSGINSKRKRDQLWLVVVGVFCGLAPTLLFALIAPHQFYFGVFTYSLEAPQQWWTSIGQAARLEPLHKLASLVKMAGRGSCLAALLLAVAMRRRSKEAVLLDCMILGGLAGSYLPDPAFQQYLVPMLPPLFVRLAMFAPGRLGSQRAAAIVFTFTSVVGLARTASYSAKASDAGSPLIKALEQAQWIARAANGGRVVTLSPEVASGSDVNLDRGFATGPFLFRTDNELAAQASRLASSMNWARLDRLEQAPPDIILIGGETRSSSNHPHGLDAHLELWATKHCYSRTDVPESHIIFFRRIPNCP